jgi:hypothetical protein
VERGESKRGGGLKAKPSKRVSKRISLKKTSIPNDNKSAESNSKNKIAWKATEWQYPTTVLAATPQEMIQLEQFVYDKVNFALITLGTYIS